MYAARGTIRLSTPLQVPTLGGPRHPRNRYGKLTNRYQSRWQSEVTRDSTRSGCGNERPVRRHRNHLPRVQSPPLDSGLPEGDASRDGTAVTRRTAGASARCIPAFGCGHRNSIAVGAATQIDARSITFLEGFLHIWIIFMSVSLIDLVIIDWAIVVWWQPDFLSTPEIEPLSQYNTYRFHVIEHLKGTVLLTAVALVLSVIVPLT